MSDTARAIVLTEMQGDVIKRRKVVATEADAQLALDEYNRLGNRVFFFGRAAEEFDR